MELDNAAAKAGVRLIALEETGSTNATALEAARGGERGPLWIVARTQTAGRGRRGREWTSKPGNLFATLLLTEPSPAKDVAQLSFVTALAVHDAVAQCEPALGPRLSLKWPNDLLCGGAKFCGILLEGEGPHVAIGIGVNCVDHPLGTEYPATDLAAAGAMVGAAQLFEILSRTMLERLRQWNQAEGFASTRADWLKRADGVGGPVRVRLSERELTGTFETLDAHGQLVICLPDGIREAIAAGDVFPLQSLKAHSA